MAGSSSTGSRAEPLRSPVHLTLAASAAAGTVSAGPGASTGAKVIAIAGEAPVPQSTPAVVTAAPTHRFTRMARR